jgi:threonine/homoserine/homoserine lactone efflux protein
VDLTLLLTGMALGFSIAAPVGPIGVLCIRRSLADGRTTGLATGLGAASADAVYGSIAAFGLSAVSGFLVGQSFWLRLLGGAFLCGLGLHTFLASPPDENPAAAADRPHSPASGMKALLTAYVSTFLLTLTNPLTILSFAAVYAGLGAGMIGGNYGAAALLVAGVFGGSALWWLLLSSGVSLARRRLPTGWMKWVNRVSGTVILAFGLAAFVSLFG